jgi:hypothetical protein
MSSSWIPAEGSLPPAQGPAHTIQLTSCRPFDDSQLAAPECKGPVAPSGPSVYTYGQSPTLTARYRDYLTAQPKILQIVQGQVPSTEKTLYFD